MSAKAHSCPDAGPDFLWLLAVGDAVTSTVPGTRLDNETTRWYDELSTENGRGPGTLTTLKPTFKRPTF
jgi:hypothetical protein